MSEEKKNEVTEEVKETRELTEKELAQVSGGVNYVFIGYSQRRQNFGENEL